MKRGLVWTSALVVVITSNFGVPLAASADSTGSATHVVISEVQTATAASASQEFIELYNPAGAAVALTNWSISYKSATGSDSSWVKHATLSGSIPADGFYLVAPKTYLSNADADWSATLAASGGTIRLGDASGKVIDQLGYGETANAAEGSPAVAPPVGQSLERLPGRLDELGGNGVDTDDNSADFILRTMPQPQNTQSLVEPPDVSASDADEDDDTTVVPSPTTDTDDAPQPSSYAPVSITELLVNPMAPQTDAHDEYIELYNPGSDAVELEGYTLRAGSNFHEYYVLPELTLPAGGYQVLYSSQTKLAMPNTGGAVALLDPTGATVDQTPAYGTAPDGEAWAAFDSGWSWTLQLTPGRPNILAELADASLVKLPKATKTSVKKAAVKKVTTRKAAKPKVKKARKKAAAKTAAQPLVDTATANLIPAAWLIAVLSILTLGYALYEFREDIQRYYRRLRGYPASRPADRSEPEGRRGD
jgi:hypothetical protein